MSKYAKKGTWISVGAGLLVILESFLFSTCSYDGKFNWEGEINGVRVVSKDTRKKVCITEYSPSKVTGEENFITYCFNRQNNLLEQNPNEICYGNTGYIRKECFVKGKNDSLFKLSRERASSLATRVFEEVEKKTN